jgi:hypothetical protein
MESCGCIRFRFAIGLVLGLVLTSGAAFAAPMVNLSRTLVSFGRNAVSSIHVQVVFVTNIGDAPLTISGLPLTGANVADFSVGGTCAVPSVLQPSDRCRIEITMSPAAGSQNRAATLTVQSDASPAAAPITLQGAVSVDITWGLITTPSWIDFSNQAVATSAATQAFAFQNPEVGLIPLTTAAFSGGDTGDFTLSLGTCVIGAIQYGNGSGCSVTIGFVPTAAGPRSTQLLLTFGTAGAAGGNISFFYSITGVGGNAAPVAPVSAVEFYDAAQDHYFMTWIANEIAILDAGVQIKGWTRTGYSFNTYSMPQAGTSPVCRFYIPPELGDSHFYGRGTAECNATGQNHPTFVLEDPDFMNMILPVAGVCPAGTTNVYRVFDGRPDANHRYMTDKAIRDQMVAKGWIAEGDGPDLVVMCAPQ